MNRSISIVALPFALALAFAAAVGCNSSAGGAGGSCASSMPASCPTTIPSYKTDVAPILATYCTSCHTAGGQESDKPLDSYEYAAALTTDMADQLTGCQMPPSDQSQPTSAQADTILSWIVCGAPNN